MDDRLLPTSTSQSISVLNNSLMSGFKIITCLAFSRLILSNTLFCQAAPFLASIVIFFGILITLLIFSITISESSSETITKDCFSFS